MSMVRQCQLVLDIISKIKGFKFLTLFLVGILVSSCGTDSELKQVDYVSQTKPVYTNGDAADDPAIWINENIPSDSLIFATDKTSGIHIYDLEGKELAFSNLGRTNNVDIRLLDNVLYIVASNRTTSSLDLWAVPNSQVYDFFSTTVDPFNNLPKLSISAQMSVYGVCLGVYNSQLYALLTEEEGVNIQFWNLSEQKLVNTFDITQDEIDPPVNGNEAEGCVFDDENETFFISREGDDGILKAFSTKDQQLIKVIDNRQENIIGDPEGIAIYKTDNNNGFIVLSSQGDSTFNVYNRLYPYDYKYKFSVANVEDTDGLDIVNYNIKGRFPNGFMVVQDGFNAPNNQNFKLIDVSEIKKKILTPGLTN